MTRPTRVLFLVHGHPADRPGGAEVYAWEVYQAMRTDPRFTPAIITRGDTKPGRPILTADPADPEHFRLATEMADFDFLYQELRSAGMVGWWVDRVVRRFDPDVIHVQHTLFLGLGLLDRLRATAPRARVIYTLHEFMPLCHHRGLLYRTYKPGPCDGPSPAGCHECFPDVSAASFAVKDRHIRARLAAVDVFVAPSRFLRDRYVDWGLPSDKVVVEEYGRATTRAVPPRAAGPRDQFGYFGQINPFKGVDVLLQAVLRLATPDAPSFHLHLSGANLELQPRPWQEAYRRLLAAAVATGRVTDHGPYLQAQQADRMARVDWVVVPSVWWENSPLVIQEAAAAGRPVIASDIGGTAEKVTDGVDGLHFRAADSLALARVLREAVLTPGLWDRLRAGVRSPYSMAEHLNRLHDLYGACITRARG